LIAIHVSIEIVQGFVFDGIARLAYLAKAAAPARAAGRTARDSMMALYVM